MSDIFKKLFAVGLQTLIAAVIASIILAIPVQLLWNGIVSNIFEIRTISFLEALGLYILAMILFKNPSSNKKD